jgi:hypothetical protein
MKQLQWRKTIFMAAHSSGGAGSSSRRRLAVTAVDQAVIKAALGSRNSGSEPSPNSKHKQLSSSKLQPASISRAIAMVLYIDAALRFFTN